ncbi:MAG: hypothetical protein ITG01_01670 [Comamonas sp.]|nr:hypothetical protein [Comamonas sp.]
MRQLHASTYLAKTAMVHVAVLDKTIELIALSGWMGCGSLMFFVYSSRY